MTIAAYTLAAVLNVFILFIGVRFLLQPFAAATGYGVPATQDRAYLEIKGVRDTTFGVVGLVLLIFAGAQAEAWYMLAVALAPIGDTFIVLRHGGSKAVAFGVHLATAAVVLISSALLFLA